MLALQLAVDLTYVNVPYNLTYLLTYVKRYVRLRLRLLTYLEGTLTDLPKRTFKNGLKALFIDPF